MFERLRKVLKEQAEYRKTKEFKSIVNRNRYESRVRLFCFVTVVPFAIFLYWILNIIFENRGGINLWLIFSPAIYFIWFFPSYKSQKKFEEDR